VQQSSLSISPVPNPKQSPTHGKHSTKKAETTQGTIPFGHPDHLIQLIAVLLC
jgi:hypothetical protein